MTRSPRATFIALAALSLVLGARAALADTVVQVPLGTLLDKRSVTVLQGTTIVPFNLTIDGGGTDTGDGGLQNGFATQAVAKLKSAANVANSLPDDGHFPLNTRHPEVVLHFSNDADATSGQNHMVAPTGGTFSFPMPAATYSKVFLFFHGADGGTKVTLTLTYSDATTQVATVTIPDFYSDPTDPMTFSLAPNLAKWSKTTTIAEANHHNIFGAEVDPMAGKTLTTIQVARGATGYLVFWGATGVATSAVSVPDGGVADAGGGAGATGAAGTTAAGGTSGTTGAAGTTDSGAGGATGAAGTTAPATGSAGSTGAAGTTASTTGAAGTTPSGGAGRTGAAGTGLKNTSGGSSGCALAARDDASPHALWLVPGAASVCGLSRRRRRAPTPRT